MPVSDQPVPPNHQAQPPEEAGGAPRGTGARGGGQWPPPGRGRAASGPAPPSRAPGKPEIRIPPGQGNDRSEGTGHRGTRR